MNWLNNDVKIKPVNENYCNVPKTPNKTITCQSFVENAPANIATAPTKPLPTKTVVEPNLATKCPAHGPPIGNTSDS